MDFFGMGLSEILVIMMLALILFGPGKLPEIAQGIGRAVREFRAATRELTSEFEQAFREVQESTAEVTTSVLAVQEETRAALGEAAATTQDIARLVTADQAPAPVTAPAQTAVSAAVSQPATGASVAPVPATALAANGRREPSKDDPLADLDGLDALLDGREAVDATGHWER
ncbi:twin-arginine translocase TatA/TatE family subunit [Thermomicrobium sp. 4228-Ro]|uniref:Sec-independent protein translocase subunit TatA/TatB n=1 Tax=Thermomicrobium sp. 4228-Ro TaxID=2993937 RepID=UPI002248BB00|nr:twin-arginine translocase TatA/TatE family subunit [Thermomicrobium sp. 4228-Ro]MCX2726107.1 twin-arginine translocase TatA/TatE family subunit [Thermomicrobium sp. 4228-Ro]